MLAIGVHGTSIRTSTTCTALLRELEQIWNDIGESEVDKDRMLMELERECLEVYRRKVDEAANTKARFHQTVAAKEAELATLMASLGEHDIHSPIKIDKRSSSLKEKLASITPLVEELKKKKDERLKQFDDVKTQIEKISGEIFGFHSVSNSLSITTVEDEQDLSHRRLNEYQTHLRTLQKEKSDRLQKVLQCVNEVHSLCSVLGLDFGQTVGDVHPSLHGTQVEQSTNISNSTLEGLEQTILKLKIERKTRIQKLKDVVAKLFELWNLMDSSKEERNSFMVITSIVGTSESEITDRGVLSTEMIEKASAEVDRLTKLKASRMKELVFKKRSELEEICRLTHIEPDTSTAAEKAGALIDSGLVDPSELLANIEAQIIKVKDEALSRKEVTDRIDKWLSACEEENWLDEYNQDDNRYSAGRGAHINLKRAERARITVAKIPAMVDNLINKTLSWEDEKKTHFLYDGVRLVSILDDYKLARQQKEEEKRRHRDHKKMQDLLLNQKEAIYGSKPSPRKNNSFRKTNSYRANGNGSMPPTPRRNSLSGGTTSELLTPRSYSGRQNGYFKEMRRLSTAPLNFVAISKEDTISYASLCGSEPDSPPQV
ncbi:65-kDa microtubule-associated protein 6 [Vigna radiata var. radiata]|uniref:65-kDa microtubule-associated protein 6 n=1 Tax=Vigna radiata var. radiata TaxID=3916 RepID=A0A1S3TB13_VIGRR|nr:65-kDa microtubule-associated protein 6 [Vigna radiata var. radiata]XP_014490962.1 65-kDa microtubule-associated protein 6 [Vigna radiata var. radiata]